MEHVRSSRGNAVECAWLVDANLDIRTLTITTNDVLA